MWFRIFCKIAESAAQTVIIDKVKKKEAHNLYKCICQRKSKAHEMEQTEQMIITKRKDPKSYWKCKPHQEDIVTLEAFRKHFSELCAPRGLEIPAMHKLYNNCVPELDDKFTLSEIESAISHLKGGKSAGDDHIISEFLSCGKNELKHVLVLLFNNLYEEGYFPEEWATGIIVPIYKKGDRSLPTNYRGITLTSTMSKLFTHILNQRLLQWSEQYHISCEAQFAYKPGYSTTDAVFVLHSVIVQTVKESDAVCCFIDFSKAFDHVERSILFKKMIKYCVSSKMLKMIENMYSKMKTRVRSTERYTNSFLLENGLMQGECLSPSLFSMYLNDIVEHIESVESMGVLLGNTKITVLKYADDLVLFAKSAESLQLGLNALHQFCKINKLTVNCDKSKVMHFTANKSVTVKDLQYDGTKLEWVNNFKYLGVTFNKSNSFTDGIEELCQHAQRAQTVLDLHFLILKTVPVSYEIKVFNALIKPILLYGSEVYGINCVKSLETFYLQFLKRALCVKRSTNTCMVLAETGQYPLAVDIQLNMVKLWIKILTCDKDQLIWIAYDSMLKSKVHLSNSKCWTRKIQELLCRVGFGYIWENQMVPDVRKFLNMLKQRLQDIHIQECYSSSEYENTGAREPKLP